MDGFGEVVALVLNDLSDKSVDDISLEHLLGLVRDEPNKVFTFLLDEFGVERFLFIENAGVHNGEGMKVGDKFVEEFTEGQAGLPFHKVMFVEHLKQVFNECTSPDQFFVVVVLVCFTQPQVFQLKIVHVLQHLPKHQLS